jgi:hypothetical protein
VPCLSQGLLHWRLVLLPMILFELVYIKNHAVLITGLYVLGFRVVVDNIVKACSGS